MIVKQLLVGPMDNFTYLIASKDRAIVIDPSWDLEKVLDILKTNKLKLEYIINTHSHFDHILGNEQLKALTNAKIAMHKNSKEPKDIALDDLDTLEVGDIKIDILYTPGHSKDSICILIGNLLFTGDTLFVGSCGRTDLEGGDPEELYYSLQRLANLNEDTIVYPGHDYGPKPYSTIGYEKEHNIVFKVKNKDEFIVLMSK